MDEKLLCNCSDTITAHKVIDILKSNDIAFRQHDETGDPRTGAYGPTPGISIYVLEKDYEKALTLVGPVINAPKEHSKPFCPKCGSEEIRHLDRSRFLTPMIILAIFLFLAPGIYFFYTTGMKNIPPVLDYLAIIVFISSLVLTAVCHYKEARYQCNSCGKRFK